ncbi:hypothetical protein [Paraburkholderia saeva]|uniref:hypothetical protein n=1 Tax=Paraburkholderia saeva TaxID=2777537 RepID=UPI001E5A972E|nr:hypothetical protein [Paraburkholderia saeva]
MAANAGEIVIQRLVDDVQSGRIRWVARVKDIDEMQPMTLVRRRQWETERKRRQRDAKKPR